MMKKQISLMLMLFFASVLFCACTGKQGPLTTQGMEALEAMDYASAAADFEKALQEGEEEVYAYRGLGIAHMGQASYEAAVSDFRQALAASGHRVDDLTYDINYYLAAACYKAGDYEESVRIYDAILGMRPKEADTYYLRGNALLMLGRIEDAGRDYDKALSLTASPVDLSVDIYVSFQNAGLAEEGYSYLENALSTGKTSVTDYEAGRLYYYMEDYQTAVEYLERLRENNTADADALLMLGRTYEALGDLNYATMVYAKYTESVADPDETTARIYNRLGILYMDNGNFEAALEAFSKAMQIPDNNMMQTLKFNEIVAYERSGDFETAEVLMNDYLNTYPDDEIARKEYIFLSTR